jgi:hypothetical protein
MAAEIPRRARGRAPPGGPPGRAACSPARPRVTCRLAASSSKRPRPRRSQGGDGQGTPAHRATDESYDQSTPRRAVHRDLSRARAADGARGERGERGDAGHGELTSRYRWQTGPREHATAGRTTPTSSSRRMAASLRQRSSEAVRGRSQSTSGQPRWRRRSPRPARRRPRPLVRDRSQRRCGPPPCASRIQRVGGLGAHEGIQTASTESGHP